MAAKESSRKRGGPRKRRGGAFFVVIEGIDGSGKSLQAGLLTDWLVEQGVEVVLTCEPTDGPWGRRYRSWARGEAEAEPEEVFRFFLEDRREHVDQVIRPALERGDVVVCDRYIASTLAYQAAQGVDPETLAERHRELDLPDPDLVLWLRLPIENALDRIEERRGERFERKAFLERVDSEYARLGLCTLDGSGTPKEVAERVRDRVSPRLRAQGLLGRTERSSK